MSKLEREIASMIGHPWAYIRGFSIGLSEEDSELLAKKITEAISKHMAEVEIPEKLKEVGADIELAFCVGVSMQRKLYEEHLKE